MPRRDVRTSLMRLRQPLVVLSLAGITAAACSSTPVEESAGSGGGGSHGTGGGGGTGLVDQSPPEWNKPVTPPPDAEATAQRAACGYKKGALPAETQGASGPM